MRPHRSTCQQPSPTPRYAEAVVDLLGALAYGELTAFDRLAEDSTTAPTTADKVALAAMAVRGVRALHPPA